MEDITFSRDGFNNCFFFFSIDLYCCEDNEILVFSAETLSARKEINSNVEAEYS